MRKLLLIGVLVGAIMALTVSSALAAQGQITEVNPSGVHVAAKQIAQVEPPGVANFAKGLLTDVNPAVDYLSTTMVQQGFSKDTGASTP